MFAGLSLSSVIKYANGLSFKVHRRISIRGQLPKGKIGKLVRRLPAESLEDEAAAGTQIAAHGSIEDTSVDSNLVIQLTEIWERLLKIAPISLDDDFFENGGDLLLAMEVLVELERLTGRNIPISILFDAPTIGQLAQKLSDPNYLNQKPKALIRLNSSGSQTPLLYFHGDFEEGGYYAVRLARLLGPDQPLFIVPPHGIGDEPIPSSIEAMAADRLPLIVDAQPKGPYRLCGYCNGGIVAFEVARILISAGEKVEMVGMIDPLNHPSTSVFYKLRPVRPSSRDFSNKAPEFLEFAASPAMGGYKAQGREILSLAASSDHRSSGPQLNYRITFRSPSACEFSISQQNTTWRLGGE